MIPKELSFKHYFSCRNRHEIKTFTCLLMIALVSVMTMSCTPKSAPNMPDRLHSMLMASAIADAMAGPHEGRSTKNSQEFLQNGGWINTFSAYSVWHHHHWNVYQRIAPAGTVTDDDRMRLDMVNFMLDYQKNHDGPMPREALARYVAQRYIDAREKFQENDAQFFAAERPDSILDNQRKEAFLAMWFAWEIFKTATSVYIPEPDVWSPPHNRVSDNPQYGEYTPAWHLEPVDAFPVNSDIKHSYHLNSYAKGHVMPLGFIHLLPVAAYFPGGPGEAYKYVLSIDFMDIAEAPHYVGVACAILADLLGNRPWCEISNALTNLSLASYLGVEENAVLCDMDLGLKDALRTAQKFNAKQSSNDRETAAKFIAALHQECAIDDPIMCTVQEMLFGSIALLEFGHHDLAWLIEVGVNYGRDNDTISSIAATFGGAAAGIGALPQAWCEVVKYANPQYDFSDMAVQLGELR